MLRREDRIRLRHMLEAAQEAVGFAQDKTRADLDSDRQLVLAVVQLLEIIGEAASKVSEECRDELPHIDWANAVGMRNRLIHAYFDISLTIVWRTIKEDLPPLISWLTQALGEDA